MHKFNEYNLTVLCFKKILPDIEHYIINLIHVLNIKSTIKRSELKKIILHAVLIFTIKQIDINDPNKFCVIYDDNIETQELSEYLNIGQTKINTYINTCLSKLHKNTPFTFIKTELPFGSYTKADLIEILHTLRSNTKEIQYKSFKVFLQKNGLNELNKDITLPKILQLLP